MRNRLMIWTALLLGAFLIGFIPQWLEVRRQREEAGKVQDQLRTCRLDASLATMRDLAGIAYFEVQRKNFGIAGQRARRVFEIAHDVGSQTQDPDLKRVLDEIVKSRDTVAPALAQAAPESTEFTEMLLLKTQETAKR